MQLKVDNVWALETIQSSDISVAYLLIEKCKKESRQSEHKNVYSIGINYPSICA
jgi:hypothetical protein